jgi:TPR repeat protein
MKYRILLLTVWLLGVSLAVAHCGGLEDGTAAYRRGDHAKALPLLLPYAEQGNAAAQFQVGDIYTKGAGVPKDYSQALQWLRRSAAQKNSSALLRLRFMYKDGEGVAEDAAQADRLCAEWVQLLSMVDPGDAQAMFDRGRVYAAGICGHTRDVALEAIWYRKAAEQGHAEAQYRLGWGYANGRGVAKDDVQAATWYRKAAEQGHSGAQFGVGSSYATGTGVAKDDAQAAVWFREAAEQGHADAQFNLGVMYVTGRGVAKDDAQAEVWFRKAARQGHADAMKLFGN